MPTTATPAYSQATRPMRFECALGEDALLLTGFTGTEAVSVPYHYELDLVSVEPDIQPSDILLTEATLVVDLPSGEKRKIHGVLTRFANHGPDADLMTAYRAELAPPFWTKTRSSRCRIFQNKTAPEIVEQVLKELEVDHTLDISGSYPQREYCVQYRETDFDFISRLLEEEGIFYFFRHGDDGVTLVLADRNLSAAACPGRSTIRVAAHGHADEDIITSVRRESSVPLGQVDLRDYNDLTPSTSLHASASGDGQGGRAYDYPGKYRNAADGYTRARHLLELEESLRHTIQGRSTSRNFQSGSWFDMDRGAGSAVSYLLLRVAHRCTMGNYRSAREHFSYENEFLAIPKDVPYRPPRTAPRPVVRGCQTAFVVGPAGEEIYTDQYGRVKIQFHWDREGKKDENTTCWVRVSSAWAGKNWGAIHIPRIGQEVIVDFLEGDPDRPIIIGRVYNAESMPPYALPANMTQSGVKSRSTKQGGVENFNEIRFEDKKNSEQIYIHAEKDLDTVVENNETRKVGFEKKDKGNQTVEIFNNQVLKVGTDDSEAGDQMITVHRHRAVTVKGGNQTVRVEKGNDSTIVAEGNQSVEVGQGHQSIEVKQGNQTVKIGQGDQTVELGMGNQTVEIKMGDQTIKVKMGNRSIKLDLGKITEEAMQGIELKVGQSSVKIDQMGVTIKGMKVSVEGQLQTEVKGLMTQINGSAMLKAGGAITMLG